MIQPNLPVSNIAFWDVVFDELHAEKDAVFIVYRVFEYGNIDDLKAVINFYGKDKLLASFAAIRNFTPVTKDFIKHYFGYEKNAA